MRLPLLVKVVVQLVLVNRRSTSAVQHADYRPQT